MDTLTWLSLHPRSRNWAMMAAQIVAKRQPFMSDTFRMRAKACYWPVVVRPSGQALICQHSGDLCRALPAERRLSARASDKRSRQQMRCPDLGKSNTKVERVIVRASLRLGWFSDRTCFFLAVAFHYTTKRECSRIPRRHSNLTPLFIATTDWISKESSASLSEPVWHLPCSTNIVNCGSRFDATENAAETVRAS